jgi:hypothetical protein
MKYIEGLEIYGCCGSKRLTSVSLSRLPQTTRARRRCPIATLNNAQFKRCSLVTLYNLVPTKYSGRSRRDSSLESERV